MLRMEDVPNANMTAAVTSQLLAMACAVCTEDSEKSASMQAVVRSKHRARNCALCMEEVEDVSMQPSAISIS